MRRGGMFHATADVWAVPKPTSRKYYKKDWGKHPLFKAIVTVDPQESEETGTLHVRLEDPLSRELLAVAPYDGQHGITSVVDSARYYVLVVKSKAMDAWLGISFRDPADSIDFSLAIQSFMQRRMSFASFGGAQIRGKPMPVGADVNSKKSSVQANSDLSSMPTPPLLTPPPVGAINLSSPSSSDEEFGEFQCRSPP